MSWLFFASGAVILFTVLNLLQRVLATESNDPRSTAILFNFYAGTTALLMFLLTQPLDTLTLPSEPKAWILMLLAALGFGLFERGRFHAAKLLDASVFITIMNVTVLISFIGSIFLYDEQLTLFKSIGSLFIITSLFIVSIDKNMKEASTHGIIIALAVSSMLGVGQLLDKAGAVNFSPTTYQILVWTVPLLFIAFPLPPLSNLKVEIKSSSWKLVLLAVINVFGYFLQLKAFELTEATRVIPFVQTSILLTVLFGIIFLKERDRIPQKLIAGFLALIGTYFLI